MTIPSVIVGCLLAAVQITVSPDQPLPYSYIDDPLIVEIHSDLAGLANVQVELDPEADGDTIQQVFPETQLGPGIDRWCALKNLPPIRGRWKVTVRVQGEAGESEQEAEVYRIDRPAGAVEHPIFAYGDSIDRDTLLALRSVAIREVRISAGHPKVAEWLGELASLGMRAIVVLDGTDDPVDSARRLSEMACETIARWELPASKENAGGLAAAIETIQGLPCSLPLNLGLADAADLAVVAAAVDVRYAEHLVVQQDAQGPAVLEGISQAFTDLGAESSYLEYLYTGENPDELLPVYFDSLVRGARRVGFPARLIMADGVLQPGLAFANGLAHGWPSMPYGGAVPQKKEIRARLFARGEAWTVAVWNTGEEATLALPWSADQPFELRDPWNNPLPLTPPEGETWSHPVASSFMAVHGVGGPVLQAALTAELKRAVAQLLARKDLAPAWSETVRSTLAAVGESPVSDQSRIHFFALLRAFPEIEERWHAGQLTRPVAVTALSRLASLSRTLCQLEAARGASFLEPLQDTLARCEEYQSLYLTGTTTTPQARARGDWIVQEVRRLMDEVEMLMESGARIEADAVAALAEWRARGLEFAVKAGPLSDQIKLPEPEPAPKAEPEPKPKAPAKTKGKKKK